MLGALNAFVFTFVVIVMRHVKPKAKETMTRMSINTPRDWADTTASRIQLSKRKKKSTGIALQIRTESVE